MRIGFFTLVSLLGAAMPALAQSSAENAQAILAAASLPEERAAILSGIFADDPNTFINILQAELRERGFRSSPPNGLFTIDTIRELNAFCAQAGIADTCLRGPLVPEGVAAIAGALYAQTPSTAVAQPATSPAPESEGETAEPAGIDDNSGAAIAFGPIDLEADRAIWTWSGLQLSGAPPAVTATVDPRRTGVYDPGAKTWLLGPLDYEPAADGRYGLDFTTPAEGGPVRIYPLRGRDDQSWLYVVVDGLEPATAYSASWTLSMNENSYHVNDLTVTRD